MKKRRIIAFVLLLAVLTGIAAWIHLTSREEVAAGTLQMTYGESTYTVDLADLDYEQVTGERVNGKGETRPVDGPGVALRSLLEREKIDSYSKVTVVSGDSYSAELRAEEVAEEGKAYLLLEEDELRLIVFGDQNSKRSVSDVAQIVIE